MQRIHNLTSSSFWNTVHILISLQASPGKLAFGRDMLINATYLANWHAIKQREKQATLYNKARESRRRKLHDYQSKQFEFVKKKDIKRKLNPDKEGPYEI